MDNLQECGLCHDMHPIGSIEFDGINWLCEKCRSVADNLSAIVDSETNLERNLKKFTERLKALK